MTKTGNEVEIIQFDHQGGTKNYHFIIFRDHDKNEGRFVKRWGKVGSKGQFKDDIGPMTMDELGRSVEKESRNRQKKGYSHNGTVSVSAENAKSPKILATNVAASIGDSSFLDDDAITAKIVEWVQMSAPMPSDDLQDVQAIEDVEVTDDTWGSW